MDQWDKAARDIAQKCQDLLNRGRQAGLNDIALERVEETIAFALRRAAKSERAACVEAVLDCAIQVQCGHDAFTAVSAAQKALAHAIEKRAWG